MYWSKLFIPTLRDGNRPLERAAYTRPGSNAASYLFLGQRSLRKMVRIVREELDLAGAQEVSLPEDGAISDLARELRSMKQLPQIWYRVRPNLEVRSFDASSENLEERYAIISRAFQRILHRCEVEFTSGGSFWGEKFADPEGDLAPERFHTPACKTIAELAAFTGLPETSHIKSLVMLAGETPVLVLLRGDHQLSEEKLKRLVRSTHLRPANAAEIFKLFGATPGSLGPVGVRGPRILADQALRGRRNLIAGANQDDYHLRYVTPGEDFEVEFFDLRKTANGDGPVHPGETFRAGPAGELAWLAGETSAPAYCVGNYGMSLDRIFLAVAEQHHDEDGLVLPGSITPFDLIVTPISYSNEVQRKMALEIVEAAKAVGLEVLLDDRDERPGVKFKDADLIGVPWRVTVGKKADEGLVEIVERRSKQRTDVAANEAASFVATRTKRGAASP